MLQMSAPVELNDVGCVYSSVTVVWLWAYYNQRMILVEDE